MRNDDAELIRRTLAGDETSFTMLVKKYHKHVHALAWRKIGDFHIAEDITQETFLKVYKELATLREPDRFPGWLYVIAARRCIAWLRKKRLHTELVEDIDMVMKGKATYSGYISDVQAKTTAAAQQAVVKQLLSKLQESERTVITLYYFGEMTCEEISKFLGVSANTIKSRLSRARQRLKREEAMIREALNSFQLSENLIENIVRETVHIKPVASSGSKPYVPWAIAVSTLAMVLLMMGVGNRYLTRFQRPYSLDARSEMTVELIDAPVVLNLESKPDFRTRVGDSDAKNKSDGSSEHRYRPEYLVRYVDAPVDEVRENPVIDKAGRNIILRANTITESGKYLAEGNFALTRTDMALRCTSYWAQRTGKGDSISLSMLMHYILHNNTDLFRFPLIIGDIWRQEGYVNSYVKMSLEGYEQVKVSAGTFPDCLKHKTVLTNAKSDSSLETSFVNGTRYLWFAKGVGIVKMRYEHANGTITEAELLEYKVPAGVREYFPLQVDNAWRYKWGNDNRDEAAIEKYKVVKKADKRPDQDTVPPKVKEIIPDLSEKVPMDLKEIRIVFSEKMSGVDVTFDGVPISDIQWVSDNTTLVISFGEHLESSKIYRLILDVSKDLRNLDPAAEHTFIFTQEYTLIFTTEGPDPVTPTFVDTTPVHVTGIEELDLSNKPLYRVAENPVEGFNFPYYLFIPQGISLIKPMYLLVEACNTGAGVGLKSLERRTKMLAEASHATKIAQALKVPLLVPFFPRYVGKFYTHALDRDTLLIRDGDLERIDMQLIQMIAHAKKLLRYNNVKVNEKVFMNGFSASGTFTNRFAILHPTVVRAVATGGINSIPTFPTNRWKDTLMRYPVGIADVKEIADIDFDETAYNRVSQYIYMGGLDDNDSIPHRDAYDALDAELVKSLIGAKMMPDRWRVSQSIYKALGIPAEFVTYENAGHEMTVEILDDIVSFFESNVGGGIVEIVPHQHLSEEEK